MKLIRLKHRKILNKEGSIMGKLPKILKPQSLFDLVEWQSAKLKYDQKAHMESVRRLQVNQGEIWDCDFGKNVGHEKNDTRPVLVISSNQVNRGAKVLVVPITDASRNMGKGILPRFQYWYLIHTTSHNPEKWWSPQRVVPKDAIQYSFLTKDSVIQLDEIRSVSKARLSNKRSSHIDSKDLVKIKSIIADNVF